MHVIHVRNVAEALPIGLDLLDHSGRREDSRAGRVIVAPGPVTTVYMHPRERVLFSRVRDANPFFHLAEALWMLDGRNDSALLNHFVRDFGDRFAEPGGDIHDAYGHRWRSAFGFDQLDAVVRQLSESPGSRQAVIAMWDARDGEIANDLRGTWRTRPCNTHAYLRIREEHRMVGLRDETKQRETFPVLDLTVCCRSNDIVWGAYGANAVHFSVLQEYLAARLDVGVGTYYQVSNNYHCYEEQFKRLMSGAWMDLTDNRYGGTVVPQPLIHDVETFDGEVKTLLLMYEGLCSAPAQLQMNNLFLSGTAWPMMMAHRAWRAGSGDHPSNWLERIEAADWRVAATEWIDRRMRLKVRTTS